MNWHPGILLDDEREARIGMDEAILCARKSPAQISTIIDMSAASARRRLLTRLSRSKFETLPPDRQARLDYDEVSRTGVLGARLPPVGPSRVAIVSAGSSDRPVVGEAARTLRYHQRDCAIFSDVGVAGLWRLLDRIEEITTYPVVIAVAGMDAALPTVLGGLVPSCILGVPTSTGYGAARKGITALSAMLTNCAPGLTVTNIDNGYGAAITALRILRALEAVEMEK